jgi:putative ABC transport system substrate-binding protein
VVVLGGDLAFSQPTKLPRVGYLSIQAKAGPRDEAFIKQLHDFGWIEGKTVTFEYRWAASKPENLAKLADELVALKVDCIAAAATPAVAAVKKATTTIPIVMVSVADAVGSGFVANLAHPGGNITGTTNIMPELASKRLELLREMLPTLSRIAFLAYGPDPAHQLFLKQAQAAAQSLKIGFQPLVIQNISEIDGIFAALAKERVDALVVQPLFTSSLGQGWRIAELAMKLRLPTISDGFPFADQGGMMFYGPDPIEPYRRAAALVDKILKGRKPADLPVEQPTRFELIVNLKTTKQLGLSIPPTILVRVDRIIQ